MKRTIFALVLGCFTLALSAQVNWGVKAGVNMSKITHLGNLRAGFHLGPTLYLPLRNGFGLKSALLYTVKGSNASDKNGHFSAQYLELSMMPSYTLDVRPSQSLIFKAGAYASYGIGGSRVAYENGLRYSNPFFGAEAFRRFDSGLGLGVGFRFSRIEIGIETRFGLYDILGAENIRLHNQTYMLSAEYQF